MASGNITLLDNLQYSAVSYGGVAIEVRSGIIAVVFLDELEVTAKCATFSYVGAGILDKRDEQTITGIAVCQGVEGIVKITDGILAFIYDSVAGIWSSGAKLSLATLSIDINGIITIAAIDTLELFNNNYFPVPTGIVNTTGTIYAIAFSVGGINPGTTDRSWIITVNIDTSGNIGAAILGSEVITTSFSHTNSIIKIANGIVALFYNETDDAANTVETRNIAADGTIGGVIGTSSWSNEVHYDMRPFLINGTIYGCAYRDGSTGEGTINTFNITTSGTITAVDIDSFQFETVNIPITSEEVSASYNNGVACFFYSDSNNATKIKTVDIDSSGNIGATVLDTEILATPQAFIVYILKISASQYLAIWAGNNATTGEAASISVEFSIGEGQGLIAVIGETIHYVSKYGLEDIIQGSLTGASDSSGESNGAIAVVDDQLHYVSKTGFEYVSQGSVAGAGDGTAGESLGTLAVVGETLHYVGKSGVEYVYQGTAV